MSFQQLDRPGRDVPDRNVNVAGWVLPNFLLDQNATKATQPIASTLGSTSQSTTCDLLAPIRRRIDRTEIHDAQFAHLVCKTIPAQCPFERDVKLFGKTLFHIPPLCKLNPFYEEVVGLRFRALCYLADECGEDISGYC